VKVLSMMEIFSLRVEDLKHPIKIQMGSLRKRKTSTRHVAGENEEEDKYYGIVRNPFV